MVIEAHGLMHVSVVECLELLAQVHILLEEARVPPTQIYGLMVVVEA